MRKKRTMENRGLLTKILAVAGTGLAWFPILAPVFFTLMALIDEREFFFDYLMPVEYFPVTLIGGGLLVWAAQRAHSRLRIIAVGLGVAAALLVGGIALASRASRPGEIWSILFFAVLAVYVLGIIAMGVGGALLVRDLFRKKPVSV